MSAALLRGLAGAVAASCGSRDDSSAASTSGTAAFFLKDTKTARWERFDKPYFTERLRFVCPGCQLMHNDANQDADRQVQQAEAALTKGADVLVITPVDSEAATAIADRAKARDVAVVAYDALISNAELDYFVSFHVERVGELQGTALLDKTPWKGRTS
jgi:D-xylose transport system substrate-binding protein